MRALRVAETAGSIVLLAGVVLVAGSCGLGSVTGVPADATVVPDDRVEPLLDESYGDLDEEAREVVRTPELWADAWQRLHEGVSPVPERPAVDFERSMVVVAAMGSRPSGGYDIEVEGVHRQGETLYVVVQETSPGERCGVTLAITAPTTAVRVPRVSGDVHFVEKETTHDCS